MPMFVGAATELNKFIGNVLAWVWGYVWSPIMRGIYGVAGSYTMIVVILTPAFLIGCLGWLAEVICDWAAVGVEYFEDIKDNQQKNLHTAWRARFPKKVQLPVIAEVTDGPTNSA